MNRFGATSAAGTASAECAWVLWEGKLPMWPIPPPAQVESRIVWRVHSTFESKEACEGTRASVRPAFDERRAEEEKRPPDRQILPVRLLCFPDTVDLRGPKGGVR
jgi:hypothetical protein